MLNVSALEKSTGKENKITITNDKSRLSPEDVQKMTADAREVDGQGEQDHDHQRQVAPLARGRAEDHGRRQKYAKEDQLFKKKVESKNSLENYCYSMKNTLDDEKVKDKISDDDKAKAKEAVEGALSWLEGNQMAEKE